jgi:hypothetical protein
VGTEVAGGWGWGGGRGATCQAAHPAFCTRPSIVMGAYISGLKSGTAALLSFGPPATQIGRSGPVPGVASGMASALQHILMNTTQLP